MNKKSLSYLSDYGNTFQTKVIASLLTNHKFLRNVYDILEPKDFSSTAHQWIVDQIIKHHKEYNTIPSMEALKVELKKLDNEILQISVKEQLKGAYSFSDQSLKYEEDEFVKFCKNQQLKKVLLNSVELLKVGEYDSIRDQINKALKYGEDRNLGHEYIRDLEARYIDNRVTISTPWEYMNDLLQGGLGNGDLGIIFGSPGGGKSWTLVELGAFALSLGYNVLHFSLELGEKYVGKRYDANITQIPVTQVQKYKEEIKEKISKLPGKLIIKEYSPKRASIQTLEVFYQKCIDQGIKPDLILIDYLDLLKPVVGNKITDKVEALDNIYIDAKGMAKELDLPVWSVSQINRAGSQDDVVEGDKVSGSYGKIMIGDFVCSLSRKRKDKLEGTGRWHIIKNRYGIDGITYSAKIDLSIGKFIFSEFDEESFEREKEKNKKTQNYNDIDPSDKQKLKEKLKFFDLEE